jgi:S-DNA-T family DNA segregation ATPase FtsK/SpoIIIE
VGDGGRCSRLAGDPGAGAAQRLAIACGRAARYRPPAWLGWVGHALLLAASTALEWTRLYQWEGHVAGGHAGGVLGYVLRQLEHEAAGLRRLGVFWIAMLVAGVALALRFSWLRLAERIGEQIEALRTRRVEAIDRAEDIRLGERALREREQVAEVEHQLHEDHLPIVIEAPLGEVPKSARVVKERQKPLFKELADTKLPQVDLLDAAPGRVESVGAETLEMTSRLIEKKLRDFGVDVRVVAALPGPVITRYEIEPATGVKGAQVVNLAKDLARSLSLVSIRVVETIPARRRWRSSCRTPSGRRSASRRSSAPTSTTTPRRSSPSASARTSSAIRSSPTWRRCRTAWSPAPPAPASRSASTP